MPRSRSRSRPNPAQRFFFFFAVTTAGFVAAAYLAGKALEGHSEDAAVQACAATARLAAHVADEHVRGLSLGLEAAADNPRLVAACRVRDMETARWYLRRLASLSKRFDRVFVADTSGVEWCDYPYDAREIGRTFAFRRWHRWSRGGHDTYVSPRHARAAGRQEPTVAIAVPLEASGGPVGYLFAQVLLRSLEREVLEAVGDWPGTVTMTDHGGGMLVPAASDTAAAVGREIHDLAERARSAGGSIRGRLRGVESIVAVAEAPAMGGLAVASAPLTRAIDDARRATRRYRTIALLAGAAVSLLALLMLRK